MEPVSGAVMESARAAVPAATKTDGVFPTQHTVNRSVGRGKNAGLGDFMRGVQTTESSAPTSAYAKQAGELTPVVQTPKRHVVLWTAADTVGVGP